MTAPGRGRARPWWRSRRLIAIVVAADVLGGVLLYVALSQTSGSAAQHRTAVASRTVSTGGRPSPQTVEPVAGQTTTTASPPAVVAPTPAHSRRRAAHDSRAFLRSGAAASFARLQARLVGDAKISIAVAPLGRGRVQVLGADPAMQGMSTTKVLVLSALLRDRGGAAALTAEQRSLAHAAITESDNASINDLFDVLKADRGGLTGASDYLDRLLRTAGDPTTTVTTAPPPPGYATTFGQTRWRPSAQVTFFGALARGCLLRSRATDYVLSLMGSIEPSESWGLGSAGFSATAFKGGWGPEPGGRYGVRQTGIVGTGAHRTVIALTADPASSFTAGTAAVTDMARWVRSELSGATAAPAPCAAG